MTEADEPARAPSSGDVDATPPAGVPADAETGIVSPVPLGNPLRRVLRVVGPGVVTGAASDDPTAIATYAAAGAAFGYSTLWTALVTFPMMAAVLYSCAKIGLVTSKGLAGVMRDHVPRRLLYPAILALLIANTVNVAADIAAIAAAVNLLIPVPIPILIVPITAIILALLFWGSYRLIVSVFKWLALAILAFIGSALLADPDPVATLRGTFLPEVVPDVAFVATIVAIMGTNISPYLFFWQTSEEVEDKGCMPRRRLPQCWRRTSRWELRYAGWDTTIGMFFSNLVVYFVNLACAATLFRAGVSQVQSAADVAAALAPLAGNAASLLFSLGLIGSGFLSVPILAGSSAYAVAEVLGEREGLDQRPADAKLFYAVLIGSMLAGTLIIFLHINPISALFWAAVLNGVISPPILVLILRIVNDRAIMGDRVNSRLVNAIGWATAALMFVAVAGLLVTWVASH